MFENGNIFGNTDFSLQNGNTDFIVFCNSYFFQTFTFFKFDNQDKDSFRGVSALQSSAYIESARRSAYPAKA